MTQRLRRPPAGRAAAAARRAVVLPAAVTAAVVVTTLGGHPAAPRAATAPSPALVQAATSTIGGVRLNSYEARLLHDINGARTGRGLRALALLPGLTDVARHWSWHLAGTASLSHNPSLVSDVEHAGCANWTTLAENVGYGSSDDPDTQFQAYMDSPVHRANILDPAERYVGIGAVERGTRTYDTVDFANGCSTTTAPPHTPAQGIYRDRSVVSSSETVEGFENGPDQRESTRASGGSRVGRPAVDSPTSGDDAVRFSTWRASTAPGSAQLMLSVALDLSSARTLSLRLAARDPEHKAVAVDVRLCRSFGTSVHLGWAHPGATRSWVTFTLPSSARTFRNRIVLRVPGGALDALSTSLDGRVARIAVYAVRVGT